MRYLLSGAATSLMLAACAAPPAAPRVANNPYEDPQPLASAQGAAGRQQSMTNESGSEIHIRNQAPVAIIVTEVTLTSCINMADPCGTHRPRVRIQPGGARRVLRLRYETGLASSAYAYTYRVEPADPERN